ncbi:MAG: hypothetical protein ACREJC_04010, partial [Tepidisphaeraceae bacterium]
GSQLRREIDEPTVIDHPLTRHIDWDKALQNARLAGPAPAGFLPLVRLGDSVTVAVREGPARQVWVGFESSQFPRDVEYVVFWTNVFDWVVEGTADYAWHPTQALDGRWLRDEALSGPAQTAAPAPGIWRRDDQELRAMCAIDLATDTCGDTHWREKLGALRARSGGAVRLSGALILASLGLLALSGLLWPRRLAGRRVASRRLA